VETLAQLLRSLCQCCAALPDKRQGANGRYAMADIGLAAFRRLGGQVLSALDGTEYSRSAKSV
jgi:hypothetical protein